MLYLIDSNVLITAHSTYYPIDRVPEFWEWLHHVAEKGLVKMPLEQYEEIEDGSDDEEKDLLYAWVQAKGRKEILVLDEVASVDVVQLVTITGYAANLTDDEVEQLGKDPFLIAYGLVAPADRCIVTNEVSKPKRTRQNRHIPDVCKTLNVNCCDAFHLIKKLGFSTSWKS